MELLLCGEVLGWGRKGTEGEGRKGKGRVGHVPIGFKYFKIFFTFKEGGQNDMNMKGGLLGRP